MKNTFSLAALFLMALASSGRDTTGFNRLYVSATGQYYFNKVNVHNNSEESNLLKTRNIPGYSVSLGYERTTRYGLTISIGVSSSYRAHELSIEKDLGDFGPADLSDVIATSEKKVMLRSIDPEFMLGYSKLVNSRCRITVKGGLQQKRYSNGIFETEGKFVTYRNSSGNIRGAYAYFYETAMGKRSQPSPGWAPVELIDRCIAAKISLSGEHQLNSGFIKSLNAGLDVGIRLDNSFGNRQQIDVYSYRYSNTFTPNHSIYKDRGLYAGLRIGMNLWK